MTAEDAWTGNEIRESCETGLDDIFISEEKRKAGRKYGVGSKGSKTSQTTALGKLKRLSYPLLSYFH